MSLSSHWMVLAGLIVVGGACQAPALTARNLSVSQTIPRRDQPSAFSILYASGGIGYTLSSAYVAATIDELGASRTQSVCAATAVVLIAVVWVMEVRRRRQQA